MMLAMGIDRVLFFPSHVMVKITGYYHMLSTQIHINPAYMHALLH